MNAKSAWLVRLGAEGPRRLVCFPPSGAGPSEYRAWARDLGEGVELWGVVLPGRDRRLSEPPLREMAKVVAGLASEWRSLPPKPTVFFGHSLGGVVAFELARALVQAGAAPPRQLVVAACNAPQVPEPTPYVHAMPPAEFLAALRRLGGTPDAFFESPELLEMFEPVIRADLALTELYRFEPGPPLPLPIVAFAGARDHVVPPAHMDGWSAQGSAFSLELVDSGHFFPREPAFVPRLRTLLKWA